MYLVDRWLAPGRRARDLRIHFARVLLKSKRASNVLARLVNRPFNHYSSERASIEGPYNMYKRISGLPGIFDNLPHEPERSKWIAHTPEAIATVLKLDGQVSEITGKPILSSDRFGIFADTLKVPPYRDLSADALNYFRLQPLNADNPNHDRLVKYARSAFSKRSTVASLEKDIKDVIEEAYSQLTWGKQVDLVSEFTEKVPIAIIGRLVGWERDPVSVENLARFVKYQMRIMEPVVGFNPKKMGALVKEFSGEIDALLEERTAYINGLIKSHHIAYVSSLDLQEQLEKIWERKEIYDFVANLSIAIIATRKDSQPLTKEEAVSLVGLILLAGQDTTAGLIGNAIVVLDNYPKQQAQLRETIAILESTENHSANQVAYAKEFFVSAVNELIRYDSSVQLTDRHVKSNHTLRYETADDATAKIDLKVGEEIFVMHAAANRNKTSFGQDADVLRLNRFVNPDKVDPELMPSIAEKNIPKLKKPVSFAQGMHGCLGELLSRSELEQTLKIMYAPHAIKFIVEEQQIANSLTLRKRSQILATKDNNSN